MGNDIGERNRPIQNENNNFNADASGDTTPAGSSRKRNRHTAEQIHELEALFRVNQHPDEKMRRQLGNRISMDSKQVKFWFQNKRTQVKSQLDHSVTGTLKRENEKLRTENTSMKEVMKNPMCNRCGDLAIVSELSVDEHKTKIDHEQLKEAVKRIYSLAINTLGPSNFQELVGPMIDSSKLEPMGNAEMEVGARRNSEGSGLPMGFDFGLGSGISSNYLPVICPQATSSQAHNVVQVYHDKSILLDLAISAMSELLQLANLGDPIWVRSLDKKREMLNFEEYATSFPPCLGMTPPDFKKEATRAIGTVSIDSRTLVETLMDKNRWEEMFSCIVGKTSTTEVISSSPGEGWSGTLQLIQTEFLIVSDLVPVHEIKFLRYCKQHSERVWSVVDVSLDSNQYNSRPHKMLNCRRLPSGCIVEDLPHGYSQVTWIEHMEYFEKAIHILYRPLVRTGLAFGAQRWLATLQRQFELLTLMKIDFDAVGGHTGICSSYNSIAILAQRMTRNFCSGVCTTIHKWDPVQLETGEEARLMMRRSINEPGVPTGVILSATITVWFPVEQNALFEFLLTESTRSQWNALYPSSPLQHVVKIAGEQNICNSFSLFHANRGDTSANGNSMLILQDTRTDATGSLIVYAKVDNPEEMNDLMNGGDYSSVALLPSGISIVPDCLPPFTGCADKQSSSGSLVTIGYQILGNRLPAAKLSIESVKMAKDLLSRTIAGIEAAFQV